VADRGILSPQVVRHLQGAHALKAGALRMFDPMLAAVAAERDGSGLPDVTDLLARMHGVFSGHREVTAQHASALSARLRELGAPVARGRVAGMSAGASARARLGALGGQNHGANARDAFVFEHLEIATLHLLEQIAERAGDATTARLARDCRAQDEDMAATINRNWTNVLSLTLASRGLPTLRPPEEPGPA
jgi:ferritin-like metal-binding protein YciE